MSEAAFAGTFYVLGFIGLAGITGIWLRAGQLVLGRQAFDMWKAGVASRVALAFVVAIGSYSFYLWWFTIRRVFRCLTDYPCGPNRVAGWIALAIFGGCYALFEAALLVAQAIARPPDFNIEPQHRR